MALAAGDRDGQFVVSVAEEHGMPQVPLRELMVGHGYTDDQIRGVLGGNFLRVFGQVWR